MRIALDGMGSDGFPDPEVLGAIQAVREFGWKIILTGNESQLRAALKRAGGEHQAEGIAVAHAPELVTSGEQPAFASRQKTNSSMACGFGLVKSGVVDAFVTAGNTGAALTNGLLVLKRIAGIRRPALTVTLPVKNGRCIMLDVGANAECKPEYLFQFGIMGAVYAETVLGITNPRVGLLSNGEESGKGNELTRAAHHMLAAAKLNFIGNIEAKEMFGGAVDVVVTDGFTGNVALKLTEAVAGLVGSMIKDAFKSSPLAMIGGLLSRSAIQNARRDLDPNEVGGVPLLGLNGIAIKAHGRSNSRAIRSALVAAAAAAQNNMIETLQQRIAAASPLTSQTA